MIRVLASPRLPLPLLLSLVLYSVALRSFLCHFPARFLLASQPPLPPRPVYYDDHSSPSWPLSTERCRLQNVSRLPSVEPSVALQALKSSSSDLNQLASDDGGPGPRPLLSFPNVSRFGSCLSCCTTTKYNLLSALSVNSKYHRQASFHTRNTST